MYIFMAVLAVRPKGIFNDISEIETVGPAVSRTAFPLTASPEAPSNARTP